MLLKAVGQPLGTAKGYGKATGKCPKAIGKSLGMGKALDNVQIPAVSQKERKKNCAAAIGKNLAVSINFLLSAAFIFMIIKN
jgi:large-conductance mechanosensitive channel